MVIARDGTDDDAKSRRAAARPAHLERTAPLVDRGEILLGAILDEAGHCGIGVLADFSTREELDAWLADDPYVTGGMWKDIEVQHFRPAVGAWIPPA